MQREDNPPPKPPEGRLSGIRRVQHDEDERQSGEDRRYGETIFNRAAVPLPRFLTGRRRKKVTSRNRDA